MWWACIKNNAILACFIVCITSCPRSGNDITRVYLASSLTTLAKNIHDISDNRLDLIFLNSSAIAKQIEQGAPCEAAIVADDKWRNHLLKKGSVTAEAKKFAENRLVLASSQQQNSSDLKTALIKISGGKHALIIADPEFVPLGSYTKQVLENLGMYQALSKNFMRAHSAQQAFMLLKQGIAPFAILYESDVKNAPIHVIAPIDPSLHQPIEYTFLACQKANKEKLNSLKNVLFSPRFKKILIEHGFGLQRCSG